MLVIAFLITVASLIIYLQSYENSEKEIIEMASTSIQPTVKPEIIYVDVSGSVNKPDLYEASIGTRLKKIIEKAGGLSDNADKDFFARNFNLSRIVADQEKIYIPSVWEVNNGYFIEDPSMINYSISAKNDSQNINSQSLININSAMIEELDTLPGVGKITAQKIIDNRPFKALQELIDKKVVNKTVFENIKNLVTINN